MQLVSTLIIVLSVAVVSGCGARSELVDDEDGGVDSGADADQDVEQDDDADDEPACVPEYEVCGDWIDNDCDGTIDESCTEPACACVPGSSRWCDPAEYDLPGQQLCRDTGDDWGPCIEAGFIEECISVDGWYSPRYEQCLIEHDLCVQDMWDLDGDADSWDSLGSCVGATCLDASDEVCGDLWDNDLDGHVDEGCDDCMCLPGSVRWCDAPAYDMISWQRCDEGGMEWEPCDNDDRLSDACMDVEAWYSPRFEECLINSGECAQDLWDLDSDGDTWESLGTCPDPVCP